MQSLRLRKIVSLLVTMTLVIGMGFVGWTGAVWFFQAVSAGFLAKWTPLGTPPGKAVSIQIAASESVFGKTVVKTGEGKFYSYMPGLSAKWEQTSWQNPESTSLSPTCPGFDRLRPSLPQAIIDCRGSFTWEWQSTEDFYAVLTDGSVWRWRYGTSLMSSLGIAAGMIILGGVCGFLLSRLTRKAIIQDKRQR